MKQKIKEILIGTSILWMPIVGCYIAEIICKIVGVG